MEAKRKGTLVPVLLDDVRPPLGFQHIQMARLIEWDGTENLDESSGFAELVRGIQQHAAPTAVPEPESSDQPLADKAVRRVFLCYRRQDTQGHTGRLRDRLATVYGTDAVFMDVDDIPHGVDFVDYVESILSTVGLMVVLIGPLWTTIQDRKGRRKLEQPDDLVRAEIAAALKREIPIIPVLVEDATMPDSEDVPEEIRGLTRRNAIELTHRRWDSDVQRVLNAVNNFMEGVPFSHAAQQAQPLRAQSPPVRVCTYRVHPASVSFPAVGGTRSVRVSAAAGCPWSAICDIPWITITSGRDGSGDGSVTLVVSRSNLPRIAVLTIAGHTLRVTQDGVG
jgi:hypothetical protein